MADWATFAGLAGLVTILLLALSHATTVALTERSASTDRRPSDERATDDQRQRNGRQNDDRRSTAERRDETTRSSVADRAGARDRASGRKRRASEVEPSTSEVESSTSEIEPSERPRRGSGPIDSSTARRDGADRPIEPADPDDGGMESLSTGMLLANVAASQGLFAALLIGAAVYTGIPADALGIEFSSAYLRSGAALGVGLGLALYAANELGSVTAKRFGIDHDEELRSMLAPSSIGGWIVLLVLVLPLIAVFEEFLFRAALVGAVSAGFDVSPWLLAIVSSIAFALGHGMQGATGVVVTGVLGLVLAAAFVATGSLLAVVVAHYLVNALEFVVHEGVGVEWGETPTN